jgi:hypothetical protein
MGLLPACFTEGKRGTGVACAYPSNCQSGVCSGGLTVCGTCAAPLADGQACGTAGGVCPPGDFCHPQTRVCTPKSAITYAAVGQPCDLGAAQVVGCTGDLLCIAGTSGGTAGTCTPAPGVGQPCATAGFSASICAAGTVCSAATSGICMVPGACGAATCDATSFCGLADGGMACLPRPSLGQSCSDPTLGSKPCVAPAVCGAGGLCVVEGKTGESCDDTHPCVQLLNCTAGQCAPLGTAACPTSPADAGSD